MIPLSLDKSEAQRVAYFDVLRILATFAVVVLHLSAQNWAGVDVSSRAWFAFNLYNGAVRWAVPMFVMISGALFLGREVGIRTIWKKNVLRVAVAFVFWSAIYALIDFLHYHVSPAVALRQFLTGHYHMWFLFMIVGLYLIVPLLQKITCDESLTRYFLLLALIFAYLLPQAGTLLSLVNRDVGNVVNTISMYTYFYFPLGFSIYFVGGYYLSLRQFSKRQEVFLYIVGIAGLFVTVFVSRWYALRQGIPSDLFYTHNTLNVLAMSAALFVFAKQHLNFPHAGERLHRILRTISKYSFGAYLVHAMLIDALYDLFGITTLSCNAFLSVPLLSLLVFVASLAVSALLHRLPWLSKYIV